MLSTLIMLLTILPRIDIGVGSAVPLYPLYTRYPDQNYEIISRVPITIPFLTLWITDRYGIELRNEGVAFGDAFMKSPVPGFSIFLLSRLSHLVLGMGPFFARTELGGYISPEEQWKNWAWGFETMIAKSGLMLWHSLTLRPWIRLGYVNFLTTPKLIKGPEGEFYSIFPANELRNIFTIDFGVDVALTIFRRHSVRKERWRHRTCPHL